MALPSSAMSVQYGSTARISGNSTARTTSAALVDCFVVTPLYSEIAQSNLAIALSV